MQISITHPCFDTQNRKDVRDDNGITRVIEVGDYFLHVRASKPPE